MQVLKLWRGLMRRLRCAFDDLESAMMLGEVANTSRREGLDQSAFVAIAQVIVEVVIIFVLIIIFPVVVFVLVPILVILIIVSGNVIVGPAFGLGRLLEVQLMPGVEVDHLGVAIFILDLYGFSIGIQSQHPEDLVLIEIFIPLPLYRVVVSTHVSPQTN
jgi:hypothetical protein